MALLNRLKQLVREIHRRSLWQVLGIYLVASWAVLQVVDTLGGALNLPDWFPSLALALLIVGLPVVLATAFVQEGTGGGGGSEARMDSAGPHPPPPRAKSLFTWRNALGGGVFALALWGVVAAGWVLTGGGISAPAPASAQSIAVMPFENLSADADQEYFSAGLTEEILNALNKIADLRVSARTSTFALAEQNADIATVATTLGVANVLEGAVRREGNQIRVTATLIEADSGFQLWSDTYNREMTGVFAIQDEIARSITNALNVHLIGGPQAAVVQTTTEDLEAYDLYLQGRHLTVQGTQAALRSSVDYFERAIASDPGFADAYARLGASHRLIAAYGYVRPHDGYPAARASALAALALDSANVEAQRVLAGVRLRYDMDAVGAAREVDRLLGLYPNDAALHEERAWAMVAAGRFPEAIASARRALALDPLSPREAALVGRMLYFARRYDEAIEQQQATLSMHPGYASGHSFIGQAYLKKGMTEEALAAFNRANEMGATAPAVWRTAYALAVVGRKDEARALLADLERQEPSTPGDIALVHAALGDKERALEWLDIAYEERDWWMTMFHVEPLFDPLRDDPRFEAMVRRVGVAG